jgi:NlpC/P60 family/Bacterial dipeptidyl-peptidase Sh3 domain
MQYRTLANLNLYDSPDLTRLATQAAKGRYVQILSESPLKIMTCEDTYPGWLVASDLRFLQQVETPYQPPVWTEQAIRDRIPQVIEFTHAALSVPNEYLWGGTVAPNYDCSGLMQAAFASVGIQLPRDAYQQEAFLQPVTDLIPGDLVFFGTLEKATHVGLLARIRGAMVLASISFQQRAIASVKPTLPNIAEPEERSRATAKCNNLSRKMRTPPFASTPKVGTLRREF